MSKMEKVNSLLSVKAGDYIKITKVKEDISGGVVKVGEFYSGTIVYEPEVGSNIFLAPDERGRGIQTSTILGILQFTTFWLVKTRNSTYVFEKII